MPTALFLKWDGVTAEQYDEVRALANWEGERPDAGAMQGLGEAIAHLFADRGAEGIVICGRKAENGARVKSSLEAKGARTVYVKADLAGIEDCRKVIAETDKAFGHVDVLVNAAAITDRGGGLMIAGDLRIRDTTLRLQLPATVTLNGSELRLRSSTVIDRRSAGLNHNPMA